MKTILHYGLVLLIIAGVAGVGLSFVDNLTKEPIKKAQAQALTEGQKLVFPGASSFSEAEILEGDVPVTFYRVFDSGKKLIGYELLYQVSGYQSQIKVLTGLDLEGKITAIKVLEQAETPGLGAEVEASPSDKTVWSAIASLFKKVEEDIEEDLTPAFQAQFKGKTPSDLTVVKTKNEKNIAALSGATITSEAVTKAVREPVNAFLKKFKPEEKK